MLLSSRSNKSCPSVHVSVRLYDLRPSFILYKAWNSQLFGIGLNTATYCKRRECMRQYEEESVSAVGRLLKARASNAALTNGAS